MFQHRSADKGRGARCNLLPTGALALLVTACTNVSINPEDQSPPEVKMFLMADLKQGSVEPATRVTYGNNTGDFTVGGLPGPSQQTGWVGFGTTKKQLYGYRVISGILPLASNPPGVAGPCFPANDTTITLRCRGKNWSASAGSSTTDNYLQLKFSF